MWRALGEDMPVAVAMGVEPVIPFVGGMPLPDGVDEADFIGAYLGELLRYGEERPDWIDRTVELLERAASVHKEPTDERGGGDGRAGLRSSSEPRRARRPRNG